MKKIVVLLACAGILVSCKTTQAVPVAHEDTGGSGKASPEVSQPAIIPAAVQVKKTFIAPVSGAYTIAWGTTELDFIKAVEAKDYDKVEKQLGFRQNQNSVDSRGNSVLLYAVDTDNTSLVRLLLENGATVDLANKQKQTPLLYAISKNSYPLVETLVSAGASVNDGDANGIVPLLLAVQNRNAEIVQYLLTRGARVSDRDKAGNVVLHIAAANEDFQTSRTLIENGADVYAANQSGITPLDLLRQAQRPELRDLAARY